MDVSALIISLVNLVVNALLVPIIVAIAFFIKNIKEIKTPHIEITTRGQIV